MQTTSTLQAAAIVAAAKKYHKIIAVLTVLAVIAFVAIACPAVLHNIVQDILAKR